MDDKKLLGIIAELETAAKALEPPFLALPEEGWTPEKLAYWRGAKHAHEAVISALKETAPPQL